MQGLAELRVALWPIAFRTADWSNRPFKGIDGWVEIQIKLSEPVVLLGGSSIWRVEREGSSRSDADRELPRHFGPSSSQVRLQTSAHRHRPLRARSVFFVPGCCRVPLMSMSLSLTPSVPRIQCAKGSGADAGLMGVTGYMIRPTARFMYWHKSTMARPLRVAIRLPPHKCGRRFRPRNVITSRSAISF